MQTIKTFFRSSANPEEISLFIKGISAFAVLSGLDATVVSQLGSTVVSFLTQVATLWALGATIIGLMRKIYLGRWAASVYSKY